MYLTAASAAAAHDPEHLAPHPAGREEIVAGTDSVDYPPQGVPEGADVPAGRVDRDPRVVVIAGRVDKVGRADKIGVAVEEIAAL